MLIELDGNVGSFGARKLIKVLKTGVARGKESYHRMPPHATPPLVKLFGVYTLHELTLI